jgi:spermidine synthase
MLPRVRRDLVALHVALFFSGAAGLVYESSWTRLLHRVFGVSDLAVATVLATFFLGLGLGNAIAARFVAKVSMPGRAYAILEAGVGLYALLSLAMVPGLGAAYGAVGPDASFTTLTVVRFALAALALLPPTILMGATLPVVALASKDPSWSRSVTAFYTTNTLGAVAGAALAGFVLVPELGTRASVIAGALGSFVAAAIVLAVLGNARRAADVETTPEPAAERDAAAEATAKASDGAAHAAGTTPVALAAMLTFTAGAAALGSEVVWTRVLRIVVHGTTPAFAAMLVNYLLGIAVGALVARALARRFHPANILGVSQTLLVALTALAMALVPYVPRMIPVLAGEADTVPHETWIIGAVSGALLFPLAIVLGTGLPATWSMIERRSDAGRGAALLLAANTVGGLVGSLATGFVIVPLVGTEATLLGLAMLNAVVAALALRHAAPEGDDPTRLLGKVLRLVAPLAVLTLVLVVRPSIELRFLLSTSTDPVAAVIEGPGPRWDSTVVFLQEGRNTTVTVTRRGSVLGLYNDGRPESGFTPGQPGFGPELVVLGGLPGVLAGQRHDAMIIGLGAGHTATMALATGFESVRVIELEEAVVEASRLMYDARESPFPLADPRARLVVDDARNQLNLMPPDSLDAVISQPSHPWLAGSSALYTREFFHEVDRALRDDGVFGLWVNLFRMDVRHLRSVLRTLLEVFPHVRAYVVESSSIVLMASSTPRPLGDEQSERIRAADVDGPYFAPHGLGDATQVLAHQEMDSEGVAAFATGGEIIEDDRPILELEIARLANRQGITSVHLDWELRDVPWMSTEASEATLLARIDTVELRARALGRLDAMSGASAPMVRGRLAEARGDVTGALAGYDEAGTEDARLRAAALRYEEGLFAPLLASLASIPTGSEMPEELVLAALSQPIPDAAVVARAAATDTALARYLVAWAAGRCASAREGDALASSHAEVARLEARCAAETGDIEASLRFEQLAWRARTAQAAVGTQRGESALEAGNGGLAWLMFRRVLRSYPTTTRAAIGLASLHHRDGRPDEARQVLDDALRATEHLDEAQGRVLQAAASLGVTLTAAASAADGPGASSASTAPPMQFSPE